ncbi:MAG: glutamine amidotransferase [Planctomycetota bacterium]
MPITFATPEFLLLLAVLLPLVLLLGRRSLAGLDRIRRRLALGLRVALVVLIVAALAEVEWRDLTEKVEVIFVVDHSRSIPEAKVKEALELIDKSRGRMDPRRDLGKVVVFGREGYNEATLRKDGAPLTRYASDIDRNYTNMEAGVARALEALEVNARGRIVLLTDGNQTAGDVKAAIANARKAGVPVDVVPLEYAYSEEVLVEKVKIPEEAKIGEPFLARVVTHAVKECEAKIHLWRDGALVETRQVHLKPGPNVHEFQLQLDEAGFFRVEAVVELLNDKDQLFQNNTAHGFVFARGKAQVLYVHDEADPDATEAHHFLSALRAAEIRMKVISAVDFPLTAGELQTYDAIILDDVAKPAFSESQLKNIETAVADMGIGLIMIGGARSFGAGEWRHTPVEKALPVEMDIKQEQVIPDGALMMIMHSCEMAEGNAMAIQVCQKSVDALSAKDTVGVLLYGNGSEWAVQPTKARNKAAIKAAIRQMQIGDMPDFDPIFQMGVGALEKLGSAVKHMIVMSDGDPSAPSASLLKRCVKAKITVSTICYFAHGGAQGPSVDLMKRIANVTGGKYYYLDDPNALPRIFLKESKRVTRSLIVNKTITPAPRGASQVLTGLDGFPQLTGYVLTEAKPTAEVALTAPDGSPILAHWQYGVGKSLAFTSDAKPRWATSWVTWEGFKPFWSQAVRFVKKDVQEDAFDFSTKLDGDKGVIVLDAVKNGREVSGLNVTARIASPDPNVKAKEVKLVQQGAGRYVGRFPVDKVGTYSVSLLSLDEEGKRRHSVTTGLVVPYSDEFKKLRSDRVFLEELARAGNGRLIEAKQLADFEVNPWDRTKLGEKSAVEERWPLALALALLIFFLDVGVRRVAIDWDKLFARAKAAMTRKKDVPRTMDRLRERKQKVQQVREETLAKFEAPDGAQTGPVDLPGAGGPRAERPKGQQKKPAAAPPPEEGGYTNRLLEAKRRARRELEDQDNKKD